MLARITVAFIGAVFGILALTGATPQESPGTCVQHPDYPTTVLCVPSEDPDGASLDHVQDNGDAHYVGGSRYVSSTYTFVPAGQECRSFDGRPDGGILIEVCVPAVSPYGAAIETLWEDGSARYVDGWSFDPEDNSYDLN